MTEPLVPGKQWLATKKGHAYLVYPHSPRPLVGEAVVLVGDAAGMAYSPSGEGIRPAVETGLIAADVLEAAGGDHRSQRLEPCREGRSSRRAIRGGGATV